MKINSFTSIHILMQQKLINDLIQQICRDMKQAEHTNWKATFDIRKRPNNGKLFQNQKIPFQQLAPKKSMGKKYMQEQNIFKQKFEQPKKQHRQIVMSEQFIRSSKLFRLLKQKMDRCDSMYMKQVNTLNQVKNLIMKQKLKLKEDIMELKSQNYQQKIELWELKNKLMELKTTYHEEQDQSRRLGEANYAEYEGEMQEGENQMQEGYQNQEQRQNSQQNKDTEEHNICSENHELKKPSLQEEYTDKFTSLVEDKNHFSQILQELMSLKAERNRMQKQFIHPQDKHPEQQQKNMFELNKQKFSNSCEQN